MKREFLIDRQGKTFTLYAGLLDEAHQNGLKSIRTKLIQAPGPENNDTTICIAEVEMGDGRVFSGIGDANPQNVSRNIAAHAIRMAETRAKARALRDAINVGTVALEELGDDDEPQGYQARQAAPVRAAAPTPIRQAPAPVAGGARVDRATPAQVRAVYLIARDQHGWSEDVIDERSRTQYGAAVPDLTKQQAGELITAIKADESARGIAPGAPPTDESPLRAEVRALHAKVTACAEWARTPLPADEAAMNTFLDYWPPQLEARQRAAERRAQGAQRPGR